MCLRLYCVLMSSAEYSAASWWRHQMETFSALLAICAGNSPVPGEFPAQRPVTRSFDVFFDLRLNKRSSKQSWGWWFETLSCPLWRHFNVKSVSQNTLQNIYLVSLVCPSLPDGSTLPVLRQGNYWTTKSRSWLLMPWLLSRQVINNHGTDFVG